jgi:hypothetical protein
MCIYICINIYMKNYTYIFMYVYILMYIYIKSNNSPHQKKQFRHVNIHIYKYLYIHKCVYKYKYIFIYKYLYMYIYIHKFISIYIKARNTCLPHVTFIFWTSLFFHQLEDSLRLLLTFC